MELKASKFAYMTGTVDVVNICHRGLLRILIACSLVLLSAL